MLIHFHLNQIGWLETTRRTETSKYPEEKKSTEIALVAASERADSLNPCMCKFQDVAACGVVGRLCGSLYLPCAVTKSIHSRSGLESPTREGNSPVSEMNGSASR